MADLRGDRKGGPVLWPWLIGLVVLALLIWAIAELVSTDRGVDTVAEAQAATADSTATAGPAAPTEPAVGVTPLGALVPLGIQHVGQRVRASGQVLTKPAEGGFWLRSEGSAVIWVRSQQGVKPGQEVQDIGGVLQATRPGQAEQRLKGTDVQQQAAGATGTQLATEVYLDTAPGGSASDTAATRSGGTAAGVARQRARMGARRRG